MDSSSDFPIEKTSQIRSDLVTNGSKKLHPLQGYVEPAQVGIAPAAAYDSLGQYWQMLNRHRILLLCFALIGLAAAIAISLLQTPIYRARTSLEIQDFNENFLDLKTVDPTNPTAEHSSTSDTYLDTQIQLLQSDSLIERVIDKLNMREPRPATGWRAIAAGTRRMIGLESFSHLPEREELLRKTKANLTVRAAGGTRLLEVMYDSPDPKLASDFANTLVSEFVKQDQDVRWKSTQGTVEWLTGHLAETKTKLEQSESALQDYARTSGLNFTSTEGNDNVADARLKELQESVSTAQSDRMTKQARFEEAQNKPVESLPDILDDPALRDYNQKLTDLQRELADLSTTLTPAHVKVQRVQAQIAELQSAAEKEREQVVSRVQGDYDSARRREKLLSDAYAKQQQTVSEQSSKSIHYQTLKGDVDSNRQIYEAMLQRIKQAELASAMRVSNVLVVDPAKAPFLPYKPNVPMNSAIGLFGGLFMSVGFVLIQGRFGRRMLAPGDTRSFLNLPELGAIPLAETAAEYSKRKPGNSLMFPRPAAPLPGGAGADSPELATWQRNMSLLAECVRATLTSVLLPDSNGAHPQVVLFTSASLGDGKTTVASNLAIAMAEIGRKVLILEGDLRRPRLHQVFGVPVSPGLSNVLTGITPLDTMPLSKLVSETQIPGLYVLPSGNSMAATSRLFYSTRMAALMGRLRAEFDMILIDAPPMIHVADARLLGRFTDGVILVIRAGRTTPESALYASQRFAEDGTRVLGTILNNWDPKNNEGYYSYEEYSRGYGSTERQVG